MRRLVIIAALVAALSSQGQTTYKYIYREANGGYCWTFGVLGGTVGQYDGMTRGAMGLNITAFGVYADWLFSLNSVDKYSTHSYTSPSCGAWHVGFQIPITMQWRVIPVVGHFSAGWTVTDGSHWWVDDGGVHNLQTDGEGTIKGFDYGIIAVYHIPDRSGFPIEFNFNLGLTRHCLYGGVSMNVNID